MFFILTSLLDVAFQQKFRLLKVENRFLTGERDLTKGRATQGHQKVFTHIFKLWCSDMKMANTRLTFP